jgi:dipeptidyl aminopeptidase/acylaminoacyl peptidase
MHKWTLVLATLLVTCTGWCGSPTGARSPKDTLTIPQALTRYNIGTPLLSPDGSRAVVAISPAVAPADSQITHLWMLDLKTKKFRQFTNSPKSESSPKWSPDGRTLAYLSKRTGVSEIFLIEMDGGEGLQLTRSKEDIRMFEWAPDGKSIIYITEEALADSLKSRKDRKFDEEVVSEQERPSCLYQFDIAAKAARFLTKRNWSVHEMKTIPHSNALLLLAEPLPAEEIPVLQLAKFGLGDSSLTMLAAPPNSSFDGFVPSPDGLTAAFAGARDDGPVAHDLFLHDLVGNAYRNVTAKSLDRPVAEYRFTDNHTLLGLVENGFGRKLFVVTNDGKVAPQGLKDDIQSFDVSPDGTLVYVRVGFTELPELYLLSAGGQPEKVSTLNEAIPSAGLVAPTLFTYRSFDGKPVEAALYKPGALAPNAKIPMITYIHGGPTGGFSAAYSPWVQLLVQQGYAVFCPNIRGSTGYGWDFLTANRRDWGGADFKDIMAGIDYLIKNESIDSSRLGIAGWSYGGYMAEWAITQTTRFKASVSGAGMANLASEFGTENGPAYDHWFWGPPYENAELFLKHSPIAFLRHAKTPTLIIQGEEDETDPKGQSQELYRGLHYYHVPCELVLYLREPHGFRELNHNVDFYRRMLEWFRRWV